ncbi:MAG: hypothetical protein NTZ16_12585 [Verrucomicrobia bacterium]|nr:hypothetical protein [Verrucomicrobiota bacterium]
MKTPIQKILESFQTVGGNCVMTAELADIQAAMAEHSALLEGLDSEGNYMRDLNAQMTAALANVPK